MSQPNDYTVGWICAIQTEYVAAQVFLDEEHDPPESLARNDNNDYSLGRIGKHNTVIAVLPDGEYGTSSAARVAKGMLLSFPNVRIGLIVGVAGGAPSPSCDIRLGDVVVSAPRDGKGGVFQYDFGKKIQGEELQPTLFLDQPPEILRTAMAGLKARYEIKGNRLEEAINDVLGRNPRLQRRYKRPDPNSDRLFRADITHDSACAMVCSEETSNLVSREEWIREDEDDPAIHYGLIASANQLMKDASIRDKLAAKGVLCFEMEAAGLMNHFPCLVIRGICDYSDTHKNKNWQGYAAMAAAAYAKDLLCRIPPNKVEAERMIDLREALEDHRNIAREHLDIAKEQLQGQKYQSRARLSEKEEECHQLFRLTAGTGNATYDWYKDRVENRVEGTCMWFLDHEHFQAWLGQESGPLLVSADPGCGKSVLAKYLIDHYLPQSTTTSTICYFFFKDQDQKTVRQALCALLHQLFSQKESLIKHAMAEFRKDGEGLIGSTVSLWKVLRNAVSDPEAGPVIVVLDALDECDESEFQDLIRNVESQFHSDQLGHNSLKYLLTCRPYDEIVGKFRGLGATFPNIHIPGEEKSETISQEVNHVIMHRVNQLYPERTTLSPKAKSVKKHLVKSLKKITHRTYLWVYLVFDYLEKEGLEKNTEKGVESTIAKFPKSVNEAYEKILNRSKDYSMVRKVLSIILAASRPLTLREMNIALNIDDTLQSFRDLDLEDEEEFKTRLRTLCGLFVSIYRGRVYFLHQTAREFLLADPTLPMTAPLGLRWHHSITIQNAHTVLAELCVLYLNFFNSDIDDADGKSANSFDRYGSDIGDAGSNNSAHSSSEYGSNNSAHSSSEYGSNNSAHSSSEYTFLDYSAQTWGAHFREASIIDDAPIIPFVLKICQLDSKSFSLWLGVYWKMTDPWGYPPRYFTNLMVASYYGHSAVVRLLLEQGADIEAKDDELGRTALLWAAESGHEAIIRLLLEQGANIEAKDDKLGWTALLLAAKNGHEAIVRLLLVKGADIEVKNDKLGQTALLWAAQIRHEAMLRLLPEQRAGIKAKDSIFGQTALLLAAENGHEAIIRLLLEKGADIEVKDNTYGQTALLWATENGHEAIIRLLLEQGANIEAKDDEPGWTALLWAAENGHEAIIRLLLEQGADIEAKDDGDGMTALLKAIENGHKAIVRLLLEQGADIEVKDNAYGQTALLWATENGHEAIVRLLLEQGADIEVKDDVFGQTALLWAARKGHEAIIRLLLEQGADIEAKDDGDGMIALLKAVENGNEAIIRLLLEQGADMEANMFFVRRRYSGLLRRRSARVSSGSSKHGLGKYKTIPSQKRV